MRKIHTLLCTVLATSSLLAQETSDEDVVESKLDCLKEFDGFAEQLMSFMNVPGVAISVVRDGEVVLKKGYGLRNMEKVLPVTTNTLFPVGSLSKAFTTFMLGQLVDEGLLDWDDPVADHIPYFRLSDPHTTYSITIRDFLTHISGYARHDGIWYNETYERAEIIKRLQYLEPINRLRENFLYMQLGYTVAAHAAECTTGKSYERLIKEQILAPLKMNKTVFTIDDLTASDDYANGYREKNKEVYSVKFLKADTICPAGGLNSNVNDLTKWLQLLQDRGGELLNDSTFHEITSPQVISDFITKPEYQLQDLVPLEAYGLGWMMINYRGHLIIFHGGNIDGFSSVVMTLPTSNISIAILTNKNMTPLPYFLGLFVLEQMLDLPPLDWLGRYKQMADYSKDRLAKASKEKNIERHKNTEPSHPLHNFAGKYYDKAYGELEVTMEGNRLYFIYNRMHIPLSHWHYNVFEVSKGYDNEILQGLKLTFNQDVYGEISTVSIPLEPMDSDINFKKLSSEHGLTGNILDQYVGEYSYHGFIFSITEEEGHLVVRAIGQPPFVLIPEKKHQFTVETYEDFIVRFIPSEDGKIESIQLVQPGGNVFTAAKK